MRPDRISATIFGTLLLVSSAAAASAAAEPRQAVALWLSQQLHRPVEASQVLVYPAFNELEGCRITQARHALTGATSLSVRCPQHVLPQLVLLNLAVDVAAPVVSAAPLIVRAGAALRADWRTDAMHAVLPVVAIDSGAAGAEIRVRIVHTSRIVRARILSAQTVTIVATGV